MPLPLLWLGAAVVSAVAVSELTESKKRSEKRRFLDKDGHYRGDASRHKSGVEKFPSEVFQTTTYAQIAPGSMVCCGLGGVLEHTGILIDDETIVELHGDGLIKAISPRRFLKERSGNEIFVACDSQGKAIGTELCAMRAVKQVMTYQDYHIINNNCHRFVWQCISGRNEPVTTFHQLNTLFSKRFDRKIYWDKWQV